MTNLGLPPVSSRPAARLTVTVTASVDRLPAGLTNVEVDAVIRATVTSRQGNLVLLATQYGTLAIKTNAALPEGSMVRLQLHSAGNQTQIVILSVDGSEPTTLARPAAANPAVPTPSTGATPAQPNQPAAAPTAREGGHALSFLTGSVVEATVAGTRATPGSAPAAAAGALVPSASSPVPLAPGTLLTLRIAGFQAAPGVPQGAAPSPATAPASANAPTPAPVDAGGASGAPVAARPAGPAAAVYAAASGQAAPQPAATQPSPVPGATAAAAGAAASSAAAPPALTGTVTGATPQGQTILSTPLGALVLERGSVPPTGSTIRFEVLSRAAPLTEAPLPPAVPSPSLAGPAREWPALVQALDALAVAVPEQARPINETVLPRPGPELAAKVLFLLTALRAGPLSGWLGGDATTALSGGDRAPLLTRLGDDFAQMARGVAGDSTTEWRGFPVPIDVGGQLQQLRVFYRGERQRGGRRGGGAGTRILVDVELSRLGPLQLDGLVRGRTFDLIVRTPEPLARPVQNEITRIFVDSCTCTELQGEIAFRAPQEFVHPDVGEVEPAAIGVTA